MKQLTFGLALFFLAPISRGAITQAINPAADAFVAASNPTANFGAAGGLAIAPAQTPNGEFRSVIRFDLAPVKSAFDASFGAGNWQITDVSLRLTTTLPNNPIFNANAPGQFAIEWMQDDSWIEGTGMPSAPGAAGLNLNTLPTFLANGTAPIGTFNFVGGNSGSASYPLSLQTNFTNDVTGGALVSLHLFAADSAIGFLFNSRNVGTPGNRPELSITADAIPEPSTLGLLVMTFGVLRRRR
jgi:hypothetical protein